MIAPDEKSIVDELRRLVDKVEEMKTQRALLMLQLRESLRDDDITDQIAHNDEEKNAFSTMVQKEIAKHQNLVSRNLIMNIVIYKLVSYYFAYPLPLDALSVGSIIIDNNRLYSCCQ